MTLLTSVLAFVFLLKVKMEHWSNWVKKVIKTISVLSLPMYLTSCVADSIVYRLLRERVPNVTDRFFYYVPVMGMVFLISLVRAVLVDGVSKRMKKVFEVVR